MTDALAVDLSHLQSMLCRVDEVVDACREATLVCDRIAATTGMPCGLPLADGVRRGWQHTAEHRSVIQRAINTIEFLLSVIEELKKSGATPERTDQLCGE